MIRFIPWHIVEELSRIGSRSTNWLNNTHISVSSLSICCMINYTLNPSYNRVHQVSEHWTNH